MFSFAVFNIIFFFFSEIVNSEDTPGTLGNQRVQAVGPADLPQPASALC